MLAKRFDKIFESVIDQIKKLDRNDKIKLALAKKARTFTSFAKVAR